MTPGIRPVTHLFLSEVTSDSVLVAWSAPAPPADLFILSYSSSDGTDTSKVTLDGSKTASLIQGLLPSTSYTISLITIQVDVTSEPITASLTTGETLCKTHGRTRKSLVKGRDGEKVQDASSVNIHSFATLPQDSGSMSSQFAPKPPPSLSCSTHPLLLHIQLASLTANAAFLKFFLSAVSTVSGGILGETRKKGRKSQCKCKQIFDSIHHISGNTDIRSFSAKLQ